MSIRVAKKRTVARPGVTAAVRTPKAFLDLAQGDQEVLNQLIRGFERIIKKSFVADPVPGGHITALKVKERFAICERWFRDLRAQQWGVGRILDNLGDALHSELNNVSWQPDTRRCWMPGDS